MHNLGTVVKFEIGRTLKKKTFWLAALSIPVITMFVGVIIFFSNKTTSEVGQDLASERYSFGVTDTTGTLNPQLLKSLDAKTIDTKEAGQTAVKNGQLDAYFYYPTELSKQPVEIYGKEVGLFKNGRYEGLAQQLLNQSAASTVNPNVRAILQNSVSYNAITYKDGQEDRGFIKVLAPGFFLILFYFLIVSFGGQILTSIIEEKENRVIEMILTTIQPTTLLIGKLISLIALAFIQATVILAPIAIGYFIFRDNLSLPNLDLSTLPLDPLTLTLGAVIFTVSFLMYTGILMTLGAAMPTAKEANGFFGAIITFAFAPLYAVTLFVSSPESVLVQVLSYFPLTSPIPLLLRNAVGNLTLNEALISIGLLLITTFFAIRIGVRIFKFGALEYSRRLSVKEIFAKRS
jgi:ABC-2 type transport system permease protein